MVFCSIVNFTFILELFAAEILQQLYSRVTKLSCSLSYLTEAVFVSIAVDGGSRVIKYCQQVCVQYNDHVALPVFAFHTPLLQQLIDTFYRLSPQQQTCSGGLAAVGPCWDRQKTDGRRTVLLDPAVHTM